MRYLFGFLCVFAWGVVPLVGCSEGPECQNHEDCDDKNACTDGRCDSDTGRCEHIPNTNACDLNGALGVCIDGICEEDPCDDGNECTEDSYSSGSCDYLPWDGRPCDWNGVPGVCVDGVCGEDLCEGVVCDDSDVCTDDQCEYRDGTCFFGARCLGNECNDGWCDPADGSCVYTPAPDGKGCTVGAFAGECKDGECVRRGFP